MPGRGPAPKQGDTRTMRGGRAGKPGLRLVPNQVAPQPKLPGGTNWLSETREWWDMWGRSPLTDDFTENDWAELLFSATLVQLVWANRTPDTLRMKAYAELRQRMAKFGATPEDRQRLRIQFAFAEKAEDQADEARERKAARQKGGSRSRRGPHLAGEEEGA